METLSHSRKTNVLFKLLVCRAFTLVASSCFVPNQCEFCELFDICFLFQGLCSPIISFCWLVQYKHWSYFAFHCFPSQLSIFQHLMWFPVHSIPLFLPQAFFPYTDIPSVSAILTPGFVITALMQLQLCVPMASLRTVFLISMETAISNSSWKLPSPLWLLHLVVPLSFSFKTYFCLSEMYHLQH